MGLLFSISNFFTKKSSLANKWMSFSYSNSALEKMNFPPMALNNLFQISAQWSDLAPFIGNGSKVKIISEIKVSRFNYHMQIYLGFTKFKFCLPRSELT